MNGKVAVMAKKKMSNGETDRHTKRPYTLRLDDDIRQQLEKLIQRHRSDLAEEIRHSIMDRLRAHQLWPPPGEG
jgi:uncharacterized protein (DUF4415 family)